MHFIYALIAPRLLLMDSGINDNVENSWTVEQTYGAVAPVWQLLGKADNLAQRYRPGQHGLNAATLAVYSQFLLLCAERKAPAETFPYRPFHPWNYEAWFEQNPPPAAPTGLAKDDAETRERVLWLLGDGPAYAPAQVTLGQGESEQEAKALAVFDSPPGFDHRSGPPHLQCRFDGINGNFYYPPGRAASGRGQTVAAANRLPTIIWLAPLDCATGYTPHFRPSAAPQEPFAQAKNGLTPTPQKIWYDAHPGNIPHEAFAQAGFLVLAFDPIATGGRQEERRDFYQREPNWSLMGKMVLDARHAVDAALANPDADPQRIYLVGFGMGGMVATFTAALDQRVAGVVSASGFTPFRTDGDAAGTGGIRRWSHLYGWLPRLGAFVTNTAAVPVDFPEILSAIAPRPMLVIAPSWDWHNPQGRVAEAVNNAGRPAPPEARSATSPFTPRTPWRNSTTTCNRTWSSFYPGQGRGKTARFVMAYTPWGLQVGDRLVPRHQQLDDGPSRQITQGADHEHDEVGGLRRGFEGIV